MMYILLRTWTFSDEFCIPRKEIWAKRIMKNLIEKNLPRNLFFDKIIPGYKQNLEFLFWKILKSLLVNAPNYLPSWVRYPKEKDVPDPSLFVKKIRDMRNINTLFKIFSIQFNPVSSSSSVLFSNVGRVCLDGV